MSKPTKKSKFMSTSKSPVIIWVKKHEKGCKAFLVTLGIVWLITDLIGIGGNIRFYAKWIECGRKPVVSAYVFKKTPGVWGLFAVQDICHFMRYPIVFMIFGKVIDSLEGRDPRGGVCVRLRDGPHGLLDRHLCRAVDQLLFVAADVPDLLGQAPLGAERAYPACGA